MENCEIVDGGINSVTPLIDASHTKKVKVKTDQFSSGLSRCSTRVNQSTLIEYTAIPCFLITNKYSN